MKIEIDTDELLDDLISHLKNTNVTLEKAGMCQTYLNGFFSCFDALKKSLDEAVIEQYLENKKDGKQQ